MVGDNIKHMYGTIACCIFFLSKILLTKTIQNKKIEINSAYRIIILARLCNKEGKIIIGYTEFFLFLKLFSSFYQVKKSSLINPSKKINHSPTSYTKKNLSLGKIL